MLPIAILQFVSLPYIGELLGSESYGEIVFLISVFTLISFPFGNVLNNIRLLTNKKYEEKGISGDFNLLVLYSIVLGTIIFLVYSFQNSIIDIFSVTLILTIIILTITKEYFIVSFRLVLNFKNIVVNNIYLAVGYLIGTYVFSLTQRWEFIYIAGLILSNLFIYRKSSLVKEGFRRTIYFKKTLVDSFYLYFAGFFKNLITHADKLLLFPLLGPHNVAVYYSSSIVGKIFSMFISPANTVILSYLVRSNKKIKMGFYLGASILLGSLVYVFILLIGPFFLKILYSAWYLESMRLLKYTSATAIITVISGLFQPFNMRFNELKWQLYINGSYFVLYLFLSIILTKSYGTTGFAIGVLIAAIYNLIIQVIIYYINSKVND